MDLEAVEVGDLVAAERLLWRVVSVSRSGWLWCRLWSDRVSAPAAEIRRFRPENVQPVRQVDGLAIVAF